MNNDVVWTDLEARALSFNLLGVAKVNRTPAKRLSN